MGIILLNLGEELPVVPKLKGWSNILQERKAALTDVEEGLVGQGFSRALSNEFDRESNEFDSNRLAGRG